MKKLLLAAVLFSGFAFGQFNEKVIETTLNKTQEYNNLVSWSAQNKVFIRNKEIISKDEQNGQIITSLDGVQKGSFINYTTKLVLKAEIKDNKYRLSTSDPIIVIDPVEIDYRYMSSMVLSLAKSHLEAARQVSSDLKGVLEWPYSDLQRLKDEKSKQLEGYKNVQTTAQTKSQIRAQEEKKKELSDQLEIINTALKAADKLIADIYSDIEINNKAPKDF